MEKGLMIKNEEESIDNKITNTNEMYLKVLDSLGLPTTNVLSTVEERKAVIINLPHVINKIDNMEFKDAYYLSKFIVAVGTGLFDAALNYLWDETIKQLRLRISNGYLDYFFDISINDDNRKNYKTGDDLIKLTDATLIEGAYKIGLISEMGYHHLDYIRYMRNWTSAAHPNENELTGLNLINWMEICIKEVITLPTSNNLIKVKELLTNIKSGVIDEEQAEVIATFFTELDPIRIDNLLRALFSIYTDINTNQQTRTNINYLAENLWSLASDEVKYECGMRYATCIANNSSNLNEAKQFLELVNGLSYVPDSVKTPAIRTALRNLMIMHNGINNFYNEPSFARQLLNVVGQHGEIPKQLIYEYTKTVISVFLTNGLGECWDANPIYIELIRKFNAKQSFIALTSFTDENIKNKLQYVLCQQKYEEMIEIIKPNITSEGVKNLLEEIKRQVKALHLMSQSDKIIEKIHYFEKNLLK